METTNKPAAFESETCSRCAGSGSYSYCQMYGSRCFRCSGKRQTLTKRGQAAYNYMMTLRTVKASVIQPGWLLLNESSGKWELVVSAGFRAEARWTDPVTGESKLYETRYDIDTDKYGLGAFPDSDTIAVPNKEALAFTRLMALEYQETLTKAGTVAKRPKPAAQAEQTEQASQTA